MANYILKWSYGQSPRFKWFIRAITADGEFIGEVTVENVPDERQFDVTGRLAPQHVAQVVNLAEKIAAFRQADSDALWTGLLGKGPVSEGSVVYRFRDEDADSPAAKYFLELVDMMRPYVESNIEAG